jgi:hypothetical protein
MTHRTMQPRTMSVFIAKNDIRPRHQQTKFDCEVHTSHSVSSVAMIAAMASRTSIGCPQLTSDARRNRTRFVNGSDWPEVCATLAPPRNNAPRPDRLPWNDARPLSAGEVTEFGTRASRPCCDGRRSPRLFPCRLTQVRRLARFHATSTKSVPPEMQRLTYVAAAVPAQ